MNGKIFVEGIADIKFVRDYFEKIYGYELKVNEELIETKGWTSINSADGSEVIINQMNRVTDSGGINLLIFDADNDFAVRLNEIETWRERNNLQFEIFLWPNDSDNGDLEVMLEEIINQVNSPIFECWNAYETCLSTKIIEGRQTPLTTPARKTKIYGYLEALHGTSKSQKDKCKERNRNYNRIDFWNLDSEYLEPLKKSLDRFKDYI